MFKDVGEFHHKYGLDRASSIQAPHHISPELQEFRVKFLKEELAELEEGYREYDLPKIADALVDLVYVALGTAHLHGLPFDELFAEVQRVNMTKVRATCTSDSRRGSTFDVVKPAGWTPPDIEGVLRAFGWTDPTT
jgi:predicted HAD superfamily Cof-like phosphohydrolase